MAAKKKRSADQLELDGTAVPYRKRATELAAERDLRDLRSSQSIGSAVGALAVAYRLCAREVDRAEIAEDRWGKMKAAAELRALRERLGPITAATNEDDLLATLRTALGDPTESGAPDPRR